MNNAERGKELFRIHRARADQIRLAAGIKTGDKYDVSALCYVLAQNLVEVARGRSGPKTPVNMLDDALEGVELITAGIMVQIAHIIKSEEPVQ